MNDYDMIVLGGGAGGLVAAREARRRGAKVVIVQNGPVGGDCTFTGCVPSKTILAAAARGASFEQAMTSVRNAVNHIAATEDAAALARDGIDVVDGFGRFRDRTTLEVDGRVLRSSRFVVATGGRPLIPPIPGLREAKPLTNESLLQLSSLPASLTILGAGPIGCEMAQAFQRLGSQVTLVEAFDRILPREEPEASAAIAQALRAEGITVVTGAKVTRVERLTSGRVELFSGTADPVIADDLLVAVGRVPSGRGFGLEEVGVEVDQRGAVIVDDTMATRVGGICRR